MDKLKKVAAFGKTFSADSNSAIALLDSPDMLEDVARAVYSTNELNSSHTTPYDDCTIAHKLRHQRIAQAAIEAIKRKMGDV